MDFSKKDSPFKRTISSFKLGELEKDYEKSVKIPLTLHRAELADDIYDPFGWQPQEYEYITTAKADSFTISTE